ncbi:MAG: HEPN domain-containing protein [Nanoarchaeota archaeon]|mgnify:FL=1
MHAKNKFEWCLKRAKEDGHGLKEIKPNLEEAKYHIDKALYNLKKMESDIEGGYSDWAISSAFYAMYHATLALLYKLGYESTNQECSINAIEYFILINKINLDIKYIKMIDPNVEDSIIKLRERFQYGSETKVNQEILSLIRNNAKEFVEKFQELI